MRVDLGQSIAVLRGVWAVPIVPFASFRPAFGVSCRPMKSVHSVSGPLTQLHVGKMSASWWPRLYQNS